MRGNFELVKREDIVLDTWGKGEVSAFASVIAYPVEKQVYLIFESSERKSTWRFVGGKVNPATETLRQGVYREVIEEVGFVLDPKHLEFVLGILREDETGNSKDHLMCFFSYNMLHGWTPASEEDYANVYAPEDDDDDEITLETRFVDVKLDLGVNRIVFEPETKVSPMHIIALREWLRDLHRKGSPLFPIVAA